ncbi:hypothetical protein EV702DRAFT_1131025 [Suillus placidus]|uniref:Uncharacterized protein n=1 Tax=Suillus placidus TaxID=48579 RepID=A0A9P7CZM0_9AGAM|nr:hypothetical protein EV702DRAFT_1131025 [Suillus placidus]
MKSIPSYDCGVVRTQVNRYISLAILNCSISVLEVLLLLCVFALISIGFALISETLDNMMGELQPISVERLCHLADGFKNACEEQDIMSNLDEAIELPWLSVPLIVQNRRLFHCSPSQKHKSWCSNRIVGLRIADIHSASTTQFSSVYHGLATRMNNSSLGAKLKKRRSPQWNHNLWTLTQWRATTI